MAGQHTKVAVSYQTSRTWIEYRAWSALIRQDGEWDAVEPLELSGTTWAVWVVPKEDLDLDWGRGDYKKMVRLACQCVHCPHVVRAAVCGRVLDAFGDEHAKCTKSSVLTPFDWNPDFECDFMHEVVDVAAKASAEDVVIFELAVTLTSETRSVGPMLSCAREAAAKRSGAASLSGHMRSLLVSGKHSDVTLRVADGEIQAHRSVLAARSPVFDRMLAPDSGMLEASTGLVQIEDLDMATAKPLCDFMYTGALEDGGSIVWDDAAAARALLQAAAKYEVADLLDLGIEEIGARLTTDNVAEWLLTTGHLVTPETQRLKDLCLQLVRFSTAAVQQTPGWEGLRRNTALFAEVADFILRANFPAQPAEATTFEQTDE
eukprot:CAMPEP_0170218982 /NCGR_PEP_ID=MMETSP0116_2-20130129/9163_1 /TAXON_ID=400756 /ORGANISM="Durinskia baltica, Strain CSIRO CS-38" /LENGTH=374 /DNA_ID=CAMNT_0010469629 /DNA_START=1 /DNA_END=1125 /DNA_ORIENTATION=+